MLTGIGKQRKNLKFIYYIKTGYYEENLKYFVSLSSLFWSCM